MLYDAQALFSDSQAVTADAASTNCIDLAVTSPKPISGVGNMGIWLNIESVNLTTAIVVQVRTDSSSAFDATPTVHKSVTLPTTTVGRYFLGTIGPFGSMERYLGLYYDITTTGTGPVISAGLCMVPQTN